MRHYPPIGVRPLSLDLGSSPRGVVCFPHAPRRGAGRSENASAFRTHLLIHWITVISFFAQLVSGVEILISHLRFYLGETGNALTPPRGESLALMATTPGGSP